MLEGGFGDVKLGFGSFRNMIIFRLFCCLFVCDFIVYFVLLVGGRLQTIDSNFLMFS